MTALDRHRLGATLTALAVLLISSVPAHAVGVNVPLPQTPVHAPQTQVTVPGASVNVGPGGASVNLDPQTAVRGVAGAPPPIGSAPPASPAPRAATPNPAGSGGGRAAARRTSRGTGSGSAGPGARFSPSERAAAGARTVAATRDEGRGRPEPGVVRQIVERIPTELLAALLVLALFGAAMSLVWLRERGLVRAARRQAQVDALTGISNRLAFEQQLAQEWKRARRYDRPLGLVLLDLDGLKQVNDSAGHEAGDRMIRAAADHVSEDIRESDLAARLAGDEFVVLCPETPRRGLELLGAKLTERLEHGGIGASVGWAELADRDAGPADLLARADAAMYQEKARRRGRGPASTARPDLAIAG